MVFKQSLESRSMWEMGTSTGRLAGEWAGLRAMEEYYRAKPDPNKKLQEKKLEKEDMYATRKEKKDNRQELSASSNIASDYLRGCPITDALEEHGKEMEKRTS
uniref:Uncharacterized protein n=1 Tax=Romanomermis culicivorax TaxID=13658 RepID=A0A915KIP6_ROMCU